MAYVQRLVSADERLYGVAKLHWIYVTHGLFALLLFVGIGWGIDFAFGKMLGALGGDVHKNINVEMALLQIRFWLWPACIAMGIAVFLMYFIKYLATEIGLTNQRIIIKTGWIFVNVKQVDTMEVRGEYLDMGWLGEILNYAYINLDCKFIGDMRLPAIAKAENFVKAFHKIQLENETVKPDESTVKHRNAIADERDGIADGHHYNGQRHHPPVHEFQPHELQPHNSQANELKELELEKVLAEKELMEAKLRILELELQAAQQAGQRSEQGHAQQLDQKIEAESGAQAAFADSSPTVEGGVDETKSTAPSDVAQKAEMLEIPEGFVVEESGDQRRGLSPELAAEMAQEFQEAESGSLLPNASASPPEAKQKPILH